MIGIRKYPRSCEDDSLIEHESFRFTLAKTLQGLRGQQEPTRRIIMVRDPCNLEIMHLLKYFRKATDWDGVSLCTSSQQYISNTARQRVVFCLITVLFTPKLLHNNISEQATAEGRPSPKPNFYRFNSVENGVAGSRTKARCSATTSCRLLLRNDKMWQTSNPFRVLRPGLFTLKTM
jgi:hypothetical protein